MAAYQKLPTLTQRRIDQKLDYLRTTPRGHDTKKLVGQDEVYRTRVGKYRIVFEINDEQLLVWIVDVGARQDIYD